MKSRLLILAAIAVGALAIPAGALAGNTTLFSSSKGDLVFPISPPTDGGSTPGALDNTIIGGTTPAAGTFTTITGSSSLTGPIVAPSITGNDSSLGITGQAATSATGTGGAIALTGGAGGATSGAGGAVTISAGVVTTSGNGASVTISAADGAGGTNAGGDVDIVPGAAVSTGAPGTVKVNGDANLMCATFAPMGAPAAADDTVFYIATRPLYVVSASQVHAVAAGGTSTLQVTKDTSTDAPGAGTDLLSSAFDLNATANTVQTGSLIATVASKTLAAGDRLAVDFADAIQSSSGIAVTVCMAPL